MCMVRAARTSSLSRAQGLQDPVMLGQGPRDSTLLGDTAPDARPRRGTGQCVQEAGHIVVPTGSCDGVLKSQVMVEEFFNRSVTTDLRQFNSEVVQRLVAEPIDGEYGGRRFQHAAHAAESGAQPPEVPILFFKPANTVTGPNDPIAIPRNSTKTDWEVELGVVIGTRALYLDSPERAREHIAGFVTVNDFSERDFQLAVSGGQCSKSKGAPGFAPIGPYLVTADEVDPNNLPLRS